MAVAVVAVALVDLAVTEERVAVRTAVTEMELATGGDGGDAINLAGTNAPCYAPADDGGRPNGGGAGGGRAFGGRWSPGR